MFTSSHENSITKSTESLAVGQRKQQRCESQRKGSPWLTHELSSEEFYWITTRDWQLCLGSALCCRGSTAGGCFALSRKMQKSSLNQSQLHTESDAHPFVSCVSCCKGCVISDTKVSSGLAAKYVFCLDGVKPPSPKHYLKEKTKENWSTTVSNELRYVFVKSKESFPGVCYQLAPPTDFETFFPKKVKHLSTRLSFLLTFTVDTPYF